MDEIHLRDCGSECLAWCPTLVWDRFGVWVGPSDEAPPGDWTPPPGHEVNFDVDQAHKSLGANCGPMALAVAAGETIDRVMFGAFGSDWPGYTNVNFMRGALDVLGVRYAVSRSREFLTPRGLAFVQFRSTRPNGDWGSVRADYKYRIH